MAMTTRNLRMYGLPAVFVQAEDHYHVACRAKPAAPQPLQGLAQLYTHIEDNAKLASVLDNLIPLITDTKKAQELKRQRAQALILSGDYEQARLLLADIVESMMPDDDDDALRQMQGDCQLENDRVAMENSVHIDQELAVACNSGKPLATAEQLSVRNKAVARWVRKIRPWGILLSQQETTGVLSCCLIHLSIAGRVAVLDEISPRSS